MIHVNNLAKKYGDFTAVEGLTFHVGEGEIFGILGPNGAGKTTTMRMLCGLISITSGEASIAGHKLATDADSLELRKIIGLVPENVGLYDELSAYENLDYYGKLYECTAEQRKKNIEYFLKMMGLWQKRNLPVGEFSKGMKQKVAIARALIYEPITLFLDEPTANLDPESSKAVRDFLLELKRQGRTVFFNTHNLNEAQRMCDRIGILKTRLLMVDTPENLEQSVLARKTAIQLRRITQPILDAVKKLAPRELVIEGNTITITTPDPVQQNPSLIREIVLAGGEVLFVSEIRPELEEAYLRIVGAKP
jgi:ABC-2 type transport system ATP-binding protein